MKNLLEILKIISTLMKESAELDSLSKESLNEYIGSYLSDVVKAIESNSNSFSDDLDDLLDELTERYGVVANQINPTIESRKSSKSPPWTEEESMLALDVYLKFKPSLPDENQREVKILSDLLRNLKLSKPDDTVMGSFRNPTGVSMKLANFRALDNSNDSKGLKNFGKMDKFVWDKYSSNTELLLRRVGEIRARLSLRAPSSNYSDSDIQPKRKRIIESFKKKFDPDSDYEQSKRIRFDFQNGRKAAILTSKRYEPGIGPGDYWYGYTRSVRTHLSESSGLTDYFIMGFMDRDVALAVPFEVIESIKDNLNITQNDDGTISKWHINILEAEKNNEYRIKLKGGATIDGLAYVDFSNYVFKLN